MRKIGCAKHAQFQADSIPVVFTTIVTFHVQNCKNAGAPKQFKLMSMNAFVPYFKLFFAGRILWTALGEVDHKEFVRILIYMPQSLQTIPTNNVRILLVSLSQASLHLLLSFWCPQWGT